MFAVGRNRDRVQAVLDVDVRRRGCAARVRADDGRVRRFDVQYDRGVFAAERLQERGLRAGLHDAWEIVLRNQFHDVLPGTSIAEVYVDARAEHARALEILERVTASARTGLFGTLT